MTGGIASVRIAITAITTDMNGGSMNATNGAKTAATAIMTGVGVTGMDGPIILGWDQAIDTTRMHRHLIIRLTRTMRGKS